MVNILSPAEKDNPRLTSQKGLFTKPFYSFSLEDWLDRVYNPVDESGSGPIAAMNKYFNSIFRLIDLNNRPILLKVNMPNSGSLRDEIIKKLDAMDINEVTLFPDIPGWLNVYE